MTAAHRFVAAMILLSVVVGFLVNGEFPVVWTVLSVVVAVFLLLLTRKRRNDLTGK
jgi:hypothetical protein